MKPIKPLRGEFYLGLLFVMWGVARFTHWFALVGQAETEVHKTAIIACAVYSLTIGAGISILAGEARGNNE